MVTADGTRAFKKHKEINDAIHIQNSTALFEERFKSSVLKILLETLFSKRVPSTKTV